MAGIQLLLSMEFLHNIIKIDQSVIVRRTLTFELIVFLAKLNVNYLSRIFTETNSRLTLIQVSFYIVNKILNTPINFSFLGLIKCLLRRQNQLIELNLSIVPKESYV
jgi:hypothetical protein